MKPFFCCAATFLVLAMTAAAASADESSPATTVDAKPNKPRKGKPAKRAAAPASNVTADSEKVAPTTEAAAPKTDPVTPVALDTLPPPPPPVVAAPTPAPVPAPAPANPDVQSSDASTNNSNSSTRIEAVAGRTQSLGFALGVRAGHRMTNNFYVGGTAMVQTSIRGGFVTYPALELGYDAKLGATRFMPYVGTGALFAVPTAVAAPIKVAPLVYPGFAFRFESDKSALTAGADVRFLYMTETDTAAFAFNLTTGLKF